MGRIAGVPNKITSEVKKKLQTLVEGVVDTLRLFAKKLVIKPIQFCFFYLE